MRRLRTDEAEKRADPRGARQRGQRIDPVGKKPGRGAYVCRQGACLAQARKARRLEKAFSAQIAPEIYDALEVSLSELETRA